MQADRFTVKSQEALAAAQRLAGARHNPEVTPQHLIVALLEQEGGIVVPVLRRAGADPERVRRFVNQALDAQPTVSGDSSAPALGHPRRCGCPRALRRTPSTRAERPRAAVPKSTAAPVRTPTDGTPGRERQGARHALLNQP